MTLFFGGRKKGGGGYLKCGGTGVLAVGIPLFVDAEVFLH